MIAISVVLLMVVSGTTPCIAVDNSTNNITNLSISLENTSVNVSVTDLYHSPGNINCFNILKGDVDENYNPFTASSTFSPHFGLCC
jgi:hypothetical protein